MSRFDFGNKDSKKQMKTKKALFGGVSFPPQSKEGLLDTEHSLFSCEET